jgi:hypothetical protein
MTPRRAPVSRSVGQTFLSVAPCAGLPCAVRGSPDPALCAGRAVRGSPDPAPARPQVSSHPVGQTFLSVIFHQPHVILREPQRPKDLLHLASYLQQLIANS